MFGQMDHLSGALTSATIPTGLIIQPAEAWALLLVLLTLCCGVLWFLTRPPDAVPGEPVHSPTRPRRGRVQRRPHPQAPRGELLAARASGGA
jgi:hypothetical protein